MHVLWCSPALFAVLFAVLDSISRLTMLPVVPLCFEFSFLNLLSVWLLILVTHIGIYTEYIALQSELSTAVYTLPSSHTSTSISSRVYGVFGSRHILGQMIRIVGKFRLCKRDSQTPEQNYTQHTIPYHTISLRVWLNPRRTEVVSVV